MDKIQSKKLPDRKDEVRSVFRSALASLQDGLRNRPNIFKQFPSHLVDDILKAEIPDEPPPMGGIYNHASLERKFYLSKNLLTAFGAYWCGNNIELLERLRMCRLFFLHEFRHHGQQIDSNTYPYTRNSKSAIQWLDYAADAFAVRCCYHLESTLEQWNLGLAEILAAHIKGGEVFSYLDDRSEKKSLEGDRFHRQMIWHLQYARAICYRPEATLEDFDIDKTIILEVFKIEPKERRTNLCAAEKVTRDDLSLLDIHIIRGQERIRHSMTVPNYTNHLLRGLFENDLRGTVEAFRALFAERPDLVGRLSPAM